MSFARDTLLIFRRQMRLSLRNPAWVIIGLVQPILYLLFFGPLLTRVAGGGIPGFPAGKPAIPPPAILVSRGPKNTRYRMGWIRPMITQAGLRRDRRSWRRKIRIVSRAKDMVLLRCVVV